MFISVKNTSLMLLCLFTFSCSTLFNSQQSDKLPIPVPLSDINIAGHLETRAVKNFKRFETGEYLPENIEYGGEWPGDFPGRVLLSTFLLHNVLNKESMHFNTIYNDIKKHVDEKGYIGENYGEDTSEQQLFGHLWVIRALCEHYKITQSQSSYNMVNTILDSLMLKTIDRQSIYPIDPADRKAAGSYYGTAFKILDSWLVSTDVGANFATLDGLADAYKLTGRKEILTLFEKIMDRFLQVDLLDIKAQTHSTLTALRGMLKYYEITQNPQVLKNIQDRFYLYKTKAMTENYENYNWFNRPTHTEPCAVVDSYILAMNLWRNTGNVEYLQDAQLIYYNGIAAEQRANGGFGCNSCTGTFNPFLKVKIDEAFWCCTMRGSEGITRKVENLYFTCIDSIIVPDFNDNQVTLRFHDQSVKLEQKTKYPFEGGVTFKVLENTLDFNLVFKIFAPVWTENYKVFVNNKAIKFKLDQKFIVFSEFLKNGDLISIQFDLKADIQTRVADDNSTMYKFSYGPLVLGCETKKQKSIKKPAKLLKTGQESYEIDNSRIKLQPLYHLMDPKVCLDKNFSMQILFPENK